MRTFKQLKHRAWLLLAGLSLLVVLVVWRSTLFSTPSSLQPDPPPMPTHSTAITKTPTEHSPSVTRSPSPAKASPFPPAKTTRSPTPQLSQLPTAAEQRRIQELETSIALVDSIIEMHVAIAEGVSSLTLSTATTADVLAPDGHALYKLAAETAYPIRTDGQRIQLGSQQLPAIIWLSLPANGYFTLEGHAYHGQLLLVAEEGRLWAVNYIDMRQYLRSVVASEVSPSWEMAALKAQAVAARSYALVHHFRPASSLYDLGATQRYQVYIGVEREADRTNQAVDDTSGEFVSYEGGVVESLYAASDAIVASAFQGRGMSQLGALSLAKQGYTYQQILSNYYPDTEISRIELDQE